MKPPLELNVRVLAWSSLALALGCSAAGKSLPDSESSSGDGGASSSGAGASGGDVGVGGAGGGFGAGGSVGSGGAGGDGEPGGAGGGGEPGGTGGFIGAGGATPGTCAPTPGAPTPEDCAKVGIKISAEFAQAYQCFNLGVAQGVPNHWGGLTVKPEKPGSLYMGGHACEESGKLYELGIARDESCHVLGLMGSATLYSDAPYNDGGVIFGPGDVLFLSQWPVNKIGQIKPGSTTLSKSTDLGPLGVQASPGGAGFVPKGFPNEGQLKVLTWPTGGFTFDKPGNWYTVPYAPDGQGTYTLSKAVFHTKIEGGPEAFTFVAAGSVGFPKHSVLISEWGRAKIAAYELDGQANPVPSTRREFLSGLAGAEGALLDPMSGDFIFSTYNDDPAKDRVIAVRGFRPPPAIIK